MLLINKDNRIKLFCCISRRINRLYLAVRMGFVVQLLELGCRDVRVPLGGCDIAVPQQFLYDSYVRSAGDEHRGKAVPEGVRRQFFIVREKGGVSVDDVPDALRCKCPAAAV